MVERPIVLFELSATFALEFPRNSRLADQILFIFQQLDRGPLLALVKAAVWCHGHAMGRGFGGAIAGFSREVGRLLRKPIAVASSRTAAVGASCVFTNGKGPQGVGRRKTQRDFIA
jgi:hypothetical protein